ncbi:MAG: hypothetical protein FJZ86_15335 [Chloroflexi bacterium]|nr:hypothetical protein [Chloroflexota bacterium]
MNTPNGFDIKFVFLAYVPPYREEEQPVDLQTEIIQDPNMTTQYLFKIFDSAIDEAKIEIVFDSDGNQNNEIRSRILSIAQKGTINQKSSDAIKLAQNLYKVTDERNGTGLFSIIEGQKAQTTRIVLSRFKGDEGLVNQGKRLLIDYIPEIFTKKSNHYKLAVYEDIVSDKSFWKGFSIDKQVSGKSYKPISFFWIESFLHSKTALTSAQGTLQFSKIIKAILLKTPEIEEQEEIISGVVNLRNKKNAQISISDFCNTYLSDDLSKKIRQETNNDDFFNSVFVVDNEVYNKELGKTVLSLKDGIMAYVPTFSYDKHVTEKINDDGSKKIIIEGDLRAKNINVQKKEKVKVEK